MSEEIIESRKKVIEELRKKGINPYPHKFEVSGTLDEIRKKYEVEPDKNKQYAIKGKIKRVSKREQNYIIRFSDLEQPVEIQVIISQEKGKFAPNTVGVFKGHLERIDAKLTLVAEEFVENGEGEPVHVVKEQFDKDPNREKVKVAGDIFKMQMGNFRFISEKIH